MDTLKKRLMADKAALLPNFSRAFVCKLSQVLLLISVSTGLTASPGWAVALKPNKIVVSVPSNSNNPQGNGDYNYNADNSAAPTKLTGNTQAYVDDVLLKEMEFGGGTIFLTNTNMRQSARAQVFSNRSAINAEFGDSDTGSDSNPNPFVSAGIINEGATLSDATRESTDSNIQDRAIQSAFNSLSLSQGIDGEETTNYVYRLTFDNGIVDNNNAVDQAPELLFFERGHNSTFLIRAITGGTISNPTFAPTSVNVVTADLLPSGIFINTIEIPGKQELGVVGYDLNDFGVAADQVVYGVQISSTGLTGADIYGQFLTATNSNQFRNQTVVPEPLTIIGSAMALGFGVLMQRQYSKKLKKG